MLIKESPSSKGMYLSMFLSVLYFHMYLTHWLMDCGYGAGLSDQKWNDCTFMITAFAHIDPQTNELKQMQLVHLRKLLPDNLVICSRVFQELIKTPFQTLKYLPQGSESFIKWNL